MARKCKQQLKQTKRLLRTYISAVRRWKRNVNSSSNKLNAFYGPTSALSVDGKEMQTAAQNKLNAFYGPASSLSIDGKKMQTAAQNKLNAFYGPTSALSVDGNEM